MPTSGIRFDVRRRDDLEADEIVPHVDGLPLTELVDRFETGAAMQPAGNAYGGLVLRHYRFAPMADHFRGRSTGEMGPGTPLLGCACGDLGCWPLTARISVTEDAVVWDSFRQPHRKSRDYRAFGPFRFDRGEYDLALGNLIAALGEDL